MAQNIKLFEWKCKIINIDLIIGLVMSLMQHDSIWVIVDRTTNSTHFLLIKTKHSAENYVMF